MLPQISNTHHICEYIYSGVFEISADYSYFVVILWLWATSNIAVWRNVAGKKTSFFALHHGGFVSLHNTWSGMLHYTDIPTQHVNISINYINPVNRICVRTLEAVLGLINAGFLMPYTVQAKKNTRKSNQIKSRSRELEAKF